MFQVHLQMWRNFGTPWQKVTRKGTYHSWSKAEVRWTEVGMLFYFLDVTGMLLHAGFFWQKKHMPKKYVCKKTYYVLSVCIWCMGWRVGPGPDIPEFILALGDHPLPRLGSESGFEACRSTWGRHVSDWSPPMEFRSLLLWKVADEMR